LIHSVGRIIGFEFADDSICDIRVLNTCLHPGFRADRADREEAEIR
jgi:hypothetical protein